VLAEMLLFVTSRGFAIIMNPAVLETVGLVVWWGRGFAIFYCGIAVTT